MDRQTQSTEVLSHGTMSERRAIMEIKRALAWSGAALYAESEQIRGRLMGYPIESEAHREGVDRIAKFVSIGRMRRQQWRAMRIIRPRYQREPEFDVIEQDLGIHRGAWRDNITGRLGFYLPGVNPNERAR